MIQEDVVVMLLTLFCSLQKCAKRDDVDSRELDQRKTLQTLNVVKSTEENNEFEKQRTAAIAEVAKTKEVCKPLCINYNLLKWLLTIWYLIIYNCQLTFVSFVYQYIVYILLFYCIKLQTVMTSQVYL